MSYKALLLMMFSVVAFSCGETSPTLLEPGDERGDDETVLAEGIVEMPEGVHWREEIAVFKFEPEVAVQWNYDTPGVIVIPSSVDAIEGIKAGDVLVAWESYIFFVDKLATTDEGTEVSVRKFSVADAIYGEFDVPFFQEKEQSVGEISWPNLSIDIFKFGDLAGKLGGTSEIDAGLDFPVTVEGAFRGKIPKVEGYTCQGKTIKGYCVDYLLAKLTLGVDAHVNAKFVAEASLEYGFDAPLDLEAVKSFNRRIGSIPLGGSGLAIQPQLEIPGALKITASAAATIEFQAQASGRLPLGFEYFNTGYQGHTSHSFQFLPNDNHPSSFDSSFSSDVSGSGKVVIHQHIGIGIGFRIVPVATNRVGISGVGFAGRVNEDITYDPFKPNNCLQSKFYFDASAKAQIKFFIDPWGLPEWEWDLMDSSGSNGSQDRVVDGSIPIGDPIVFAKSESGSQFCLDEGTAKKLRLSVVSADVPAGLEDGQGYELDGVQVTRLTGSGIGGSSETWNATSASGGGNSSAATGAPNAKTCGSFSNNVAAVTSNITLTFGKSFKDGDTINIFQYLPGNEIGPIGACYPSGTVKVEVGDGSNWNTITESIAGNGVVTVEGSHLSF